MSVVPLNTSDVSWRKATRSGGSNCVEVASTEGVILVRDSKDAYGPVLLYTRSAWVAFLGRIKHGEFNGAEI